MSVTSGVAENEGRRTAFTTVNIASWCGCRCKTTPRVIRRRGRGELYTRTLRPNSAVLYSGICNFLGVLCGGTAVAFSIVNLLPVDLLIDSASTRAIVMVVSLLLAGVIWNLSTWWYGLPVSSSHTLIGSILGS
jgi:hypothetical protein